MKIAYLLEDTSLCGGVKVVFDHARLLAEKGHELTIVTKTGQPDYFPLGKATFLQISGEFGSSLSFLSSRDMTIATSYAQVLMLYPRLDNLVHFSQGYEGDCWYWSHDKDNIEKTYRLPVPKLTISKRVVSILRERFSQGSFYIPQGIDLGLFPQKEFSGTIRKIVVVGIWQNEIKAIRDAVSGFLKAKANGLDISLVRVSPVPLSEEERSVYNPDEYFIAVPPGDMGAVYRSCDLAIVPSLEGEGFGLPALEAMASGLPVILTRIESFLSLDSVKDYAYFVAAQSSGEIADGITLLSNRPDLAQKLSKRARETAEKFPIHKTITLLIEAIDSIYHKIKNEKGRGQTDISFVYLERPPNESSMEVSLLRKISRETFSAERPCKTVFLEKRETATVNDILENADAQLIAVSLDDTLYFSENWLPPLIEALDRGFELASPVCGDIFSIGMPYYSPSTFSDVAEHMRKRHEGEFVPDVPVPALAFLTKKEYLRRVDPQTRLTHLPQELKSVLVPSSLMHKFGEYFSSANEGLLPYIPYGVKRVLDMGCGEGRLGELIRNERNCEVFGIEMNTNTAEIAKKRLDRVFCVDIEKASLPFSEDIDVVVFSYILEHLNDPWQVLRNAAKWLKPDGLIIASLPNAAHYSIILDLIRGRWDYIPFGLLCVTHLRFFTRHTIEEMFAQTGYTVVTLEPENFAVHRNRDLFAMLNKRHHIENFSEEIFHTGYIVVAKRTHSGKENP